MRNYQSLRHAFSLVELSIVLVILGLLVGGILAGQSLIQAAELRSVSADHSRYTAALHAFRDKYFALPGDMSNATAFWGIANADPAICAVTDGAGTLTCDGNGDGNIGLGNDVSSTDIINLESLRAWEHLTNAGLIEGNYTGIPGQTDYRNSFVGINVPASKIKNAGFGLHSQARGSTGSHYMNRTPGNHFRFGERLNGPLVGAALSNEAAWNIDTKLDDGKPGTGIVSTGSNASAPNCASSDVVTSATYQLSNSGKACFLVIKF